MKRAIVSACAALLLAASAAGARAQDTAAAEGARPGEARVPLAQEATAYDAEGRVALSAALLTQDLAGAQDAPVRNTRVVVRNRSQLFYTYAQGWATFYDERGVRCGEGLWKLEAFAPDEQVEVDTPGLRLVCRPATWRVVATTLLTRTTDVAKPRDPNAPPPAEGGVTPPSPTTPAASPATAPHGLPPLEININGKTVPIQLGNPLEVTVGNERVRIVVQPAP
jgi:hypothetical protein